MKTRISRVVLLAVGILCSQVALANELPWSDLKGCYQTLSRNGLPVENGQYNFSTVTDDQIEYLKYSDGSAINGTGFIIYQKSVPEENANYYDYVTAMDRGNYSNQNGILHYDFHDKMLYSAPGEGDFILTMKVNIDLIRQPDGNLWIKMFRTIEEDPSGALDTDNEYILKPVKCN